MRIAFLGTHHHHPGPNPTKRAAGGQVVYIQGENNKIKRMRITQPLSDTNDDSLLPFWVFSRTNQITYFLALS